MIVPGWPGVTDDVAGLRRDPSALNGLRLKTIADHYAKIIDGLPEKPIIMGHSFGGLITQLLLDRGLARAGVAVDSAQGAGIPVLPFSVIKSGSPILSKPWTRGKTVLLTPKQFHYAFANSVSLAEATRISEELQIPGPGMPLWQAALNLFTNTGESKINYANPGRAPLLFIAGGNDHVVPAKVNRKNAQKYHGAGTVTEVKEFPGRTHFTVGQDGWEEVADYALNWASAHTSTPPPPQG